MPYIYSIAHFTLNLNQPHVTESKAAIIQTCSRISCTLIDVKQHYITSSFVTTWIIPMDFWSHCWFMSLSCSCDPEVKGHRVIHSYHQLVTSLFAWTWTWTWLVRKAIAQTVLGTACFKRKAATGKLNNQSVERQPTKRCSL